MTLECNAYWDDLDFPKDFSRLVQILNPKSHTYAVIDEERGIIVAIAKEPLGNVEIKTRNNHE